MSAPLLDVKGLSVRIAGTSRDLVADVSFTLHPGETLCVVGESGCGKSLTALSLMGLLASPPLSVTGGEALFDGRDLLQMPLDQLQALRGDRMAMIFQEPMTSLNPALRVGDQIAESVQRHQGVSAKAARARALEMLRRVGIPAPESRLDAYPHNLSGGMRQRVMIAMALANDPALLLADEPTTALDVTIQAQILALMRDLQAQSGSAMILITHDLGVVAEMADKVAVMYAGRIVEFGTVAQIFEDPQHPYTIGLMSSMPTLGQRVARLVTIPGVVPQASQMPPGCRFASRCPFANASCAKTPDMTEVATGHRVACWQVPLEAGIDQRVSA
ncbi:ABC transporter ATP-binding protein [Yoonia sediminilitoris]|uniref:Oligopeptide/dipeptide ABC transporter ATP-binding protein n=1 Tax=Yoonia sediminilitoris TaxID=1286148 RepID=A0A2T6KRF5_9RHOB|nr:ABC transporter ATP-binding protein [Yoonia sediminilitoris]PUB19139.1 oligopeptide/dipeptide ABC transporter ATP-binding protein [Yoonia sediminilitoris]RCW99307.1 oligopeptide/dipeptide ABC transporter ATP-binding protein [Yoonia sediminilitoris]